MSRPKSLIVLGAGSSLGFAYPTGLELVNYIVKEFINKLKPIARISFPPNSQFQDADDLIRKGKEFTIALSKAMPPSIDIYLSRMKPDYDDIGTLAIAFSFLIKENGITKDYARLFRSSEDNWQKYLFEECLFQNHSLSDFDSISLNTQFISFNYEYSLESAFHYYLENNFKLKDTDFYRLLSCRHVYGLLHNKFLHDNTSFNPDISYILNCSKNIDVMYSNRSSFASKISGYQSWLSTFERVYFLGFGFNETNLKIIHMPEFLNKNVKVFATAKNVDNESIITIFKDYQIDISLHDCNCKELLKNHFI